MKLTGKQRAFINHYIVTMNATEAARLAGYKAGYNTLRSIGAENLTKPNIKAEIEKRMERLAMPSYEVLKRVSDMASGNLTKYLNDDGGVNIEAIKRDGMGHLLKKYKRIRRTITAKGVPIGEEEYVEAEMYPADGALDKLMRYHSLYNDKVTHDVSKELLALLQQARPEERAAIARLFPDAGLPQGVEA